MRRGSLFLLLPPTLLQGLPVSRLAPRVQVLGHEGTNGHFGGLIVVVIVDESPIAAGSRLGPWEIPRQVPRQRS